ncbi:utp14 protein [Ordospora pajunii]|uniref:utp14 protein n=1 Tax=Ordospora pajunii TaxID=3039483 RepID=UPI00295268A0|nr:utp14 protein [Ordospora pajunii]KAH9410616.1 utp14 protein [Ordospora pajunii]
MVDSKITIADLVQLEKGQFADEVHTENGTDGVYTVVREEMFAALEQAKRKKSGSSDENFYKIVPKTALEKTMARVLDSEKMIDVEKVRYERSFKDEFDRKMKRIKRIKSKAYRKIRRMKKLANELHESADIQSAYQENDAHEKSHDSQKRYTRVPDALLREIDTEEDGKEAERSERNEMPIFSFDGEYGGAECVHKQEELVRLAFKESEDGIANEFVDEKQRIVNEEAPRIEDTVLPGWGDWAGPGLEVIKTEYNTVRNVIEGVKYCNRKDFNKSHVIINEKSQCIDKKFLAQLPFGYTEKEYEQKIGMCVSKEKNTLRVFRKLVKSRTTHTNGEAIQPFHYVPE